MVTSNSVAQMIVTLRAICLDFVTDSSQNRQIPLLASSLKQLSCGDQSGAVKPANEMYRHMQRTIVFSILIAGLSPCLCFRLATEASAFTFALSRALKPLQCQTRSFLRRFPFVYICNRDLPNHVKLLAAWRWSSALPSNMHHILWWSFHQPAAHRPLQKFCNKSQAPHQYLPDLQDSIHSISLVMPLTSTMA